MNKLRKLWDATTEGPWLYRSIVIKGQGLLQRGEDFDAQNQLPQRDAEFIAAAHGAMPLLLDVVKVVEGMDDDIYWRPYGGVQFFKCYGCGEIAAVDGPFIHTDRCEFRILKEALKAFRNEENK